MSDSVPPSSALVRTYDQQLKWFRVIALLLATAASASCEASVVFEFSSSPADYGFALGSGFGTEAVEAGTLLDVSFSINPAIYGTQFTLNSPGDSQIFNFGTVTFSEASIDAGEFDNLSLSSSLGFVLPANQGANVSASVAPTFGTVPDAGVDLRVFFQPVNLNFGTGGQYTVALGSYQFTQAGSQSIFATVTLNTESVTGTPEPNSLILVGTAGVLTIVRRRRRKASSVVG